MNGLRQTILLVEDDENDVFLMERALQKADVRAPLQIATTGQEALDYLEGTGRFSDRMKHPLPTLMFLDLKLPYVHGFEVLEWMRQRERFKGLPVVVLTSSPEERDRERAAQFGVRSYLVKPPTREMILETFELLSVNPIFDL